MRRALVIAAVFTLATPVALATDHFPMPSLAGKTREQALAILDAAGLRYIGEKGLDCDDQPHADGKVTCQEPKPGTSVDKYTQVWLDVYETPPHPPGELLRAELASLRGMTVPQAKQELKRLGHDGEVNIEILDTFVKSCGLDRVCGVQPEGGASVHSRVTLLVNPKATISLPPRP